MRARSLINGLLVAAIALGASGCLDTGDTVAPQVGAGIRFVIVLGEDEITKGVVTVKDLRREDQFEVARSELIKTLRVELEQAAAMG